MSEENVEIVREAIDAFNRRDLDRWFEFLDPEVEYQDAPGFPGGGTYRGKDAYRDYIESYFEAWEEARVEIGAITAADDHVIASIRHLGVGRANGIKVETPEVTAVYDFREGRISRIRQFLSRAEALEAAGLSE